jgi:hypothetical protein
VVSFVDVSGRRVTSEFTFRTSPGNIFSTIKPYSHALIQFPNRPDLEAHVGIFVSGKSKVAHECDVAVLRKDEAGIARGFSSHPRSSSSKLILAVECKFYVRSSMGIGLARSFLGLLTDIGKDDRFFVGVSEAERIGSLLSSHRKQWENGVSPVDPQERYVRLRKTFEQVFRNFRHKSP